MGKFSALCGVAWSPRTTIQTKAMPTCIWGAEQCRSHINYMEGTHIVFEQLEWWLDGFSVFFVAVYRKELFTSKIPEEAETMLRLSLTDYGPEVKRCYVIFVNVDEFGNAAYAKPHPPISKMQPACIIYELI